MSDLTYDENLKSATQAREGLRYSSSQLESAMIVAENGRRKFLKALADRNVERIVPEFTLDGSLVYPEVATITGVDPSKAGAILESLVQGGYLRKELVNPRYKCPQCSSTILTLSLVCPNCHGTDMVSGAALQHLPCLKFDFESNFIHRDGSTFCPKCERKLLSIGSDYLRPGDFFKCFACGEFTARALRLYTCENCQNVFETAKEATIQAYAYVVCREKRSVVSRSLADSLSDKLVDVVENCGLEVCKDNVLMGKSGVSHSFTVVSKDHGANDTQGRIAIDLIFAEYSVGTNAVLSLFAKALDCKLKRRILVAFPSLDEDAQVLAMSYNIPFVEVPDSIEEASARLQSILKLPDARNEKRAKTTRVARKKVSKRRGTHDIMVDILRVVSSPSSKTQVMACANLSYEQCQNYLPAMERLGLIRKSIEDGVRVQYCIADRGFEYLSNMSAEYGSIPDGHKSVWSSRP